MGKGKIRVTSHSGRTGSARHNDRDFDIQKADHIDPERTDDNLTYCIYPGMSFQDAELHYYKMTFGGELRLQNERYKAQGHHERVRTMEQVISTKNKAPDELILQIGDKDADIDPDTFISAVNDYVAWHDTWNKAHGNHITVLNGAIHLDETSPHYHERKTYVYQDEYGHNYLGQEKALEQAGLELPDPSKPRSRTNNRKMVYTQMCRDAWIEICKNYGFDVEKTPIPGAKHKKKSDYVKDKEREKNLDAREAAVRIKEQELAKKSLMLKQQQKTNENTAQTLTEALQEAQTLIADIQTQKAKESLTERHRSLQRRLPDVQVTGQAKDNQLFLG